MWNIDQGDRDKPHRPVIQPANAKRKSRDAAKLNAAKRSVLLSAEEPVQQRIHVQSVARPSAAVLAGELLKPRVREDHIEGLCPVNHRSDPGRELRVGNDNRRGYVSVPLPAHIILEQPLN